MLTALAEALDDDWKATLPAWVVLGMDKLERPDWRDRFIGAVITEWSLDAQGRPCHQFEADVYVRDAALVWPPDGRRTFYVRKS